MINQRKSKSKIKGEVDEGLKLNEVDINPIILDYMVRETFAMFDEDGSGDIDKTEFSKLTDALGLEISEKKQAEIMREIDKEGNGSMDYDEFVKLMSRFQFGNAETHLESAFNEYDKDMDGEIGLDDLLKVSEELDDIPISRSEGELMIAFFKFFAHENEEDFKFEDIKNFNITKQDFITTLTRINFLFNKVDNNFQSQVDPNKSRISGFDKSAFNSRINIEKQIDKSDVESKIGKE